MMDVDLLPPASEETLPTVRERRIWAEGVAAHARRTGWRIALRQESDGTIAIVPESRLSEAFRLARQGKLSELANGVGTSPKPMSPRWLVYVADFDGCELRTVLCATQDHVDAALAENPTGELMPYTPEKVREILDRRWLDFASGKGD